MNSDIAAWKGQEITPQNRHAQHPEPVMLHTDDYALMIHYFSMTKVDDWVKRRSALNAMFADEAMICQVVSNEDVTGLALYNKQEFIDRMTMPSGSLRNVEILSTQMEKNRIKSLRFRINDKKR